MTRSSKPSSKDTFKCPNCKDSFTRRADLLRHAVKHSPDVDARKYPCPYNGCPYRSLQKSNLRTHITAIHLKEKPHKCLQGDCKSAFADGAALNRHLKSQHGISKRGTKKSPGAITSLKSSPESPTTDLNQEESPRITIPDALDQRHFVDYSTPIDIEFTDSSSSLGADTFQSNDEFVAGMDEFFLHPDFQLNLQYHFLPTFFEECALLGLPMEQFTLGPAISSSTTSSFMHRSLEIDSHSLNSFRLAFGGNLSLPYQPMPSGATTNQLHEDLCVEDFLTAFSPEYLPFAPEQTIDPFSLSLL